MISKDNMMLIESIDMIHECSLDAEIDVVMSMMEYYSKAESIIDNTNDESIINEYSTLFMELAKPDEEAVSKIKTNIKHIVGVLNDGLKILGRVVTKIAMILFASVKMIVAILINVITYIPIAIKDMKLRDSKATLKSKLINTAVNGVAVNASMGDFENLAYKNSKYDYRKLQMSLSNCRREYRKNNIDFSKYSTKDLNDRFDKKCKKELTNSQPFIESIDKMIDDNCPIRFTELYVLEKIDNIFVELGEKRGDRIYKLHNSFYGGEASSWIDSLTKNELTKISVIFDDYKNNSKRVIDTDESIFRANDTDIERITHIVNNIEDALNKTRTFLSTNSDVATGQAANIEKQVAKEVGDNKAKEQMAIARETIKDIIKIFNTCAKNMKSKSDAIADVLIDICMENIKEKKEVN